MVYNTRVHVCHSITNLVRKQSEQNNDVVTRMYVVATTWA